MVLSIFEVNIGSPVDFLENLTSPPPGVENCQGNPDTTYIICFQKFKMLIM